MILVTSLLSAAVGVFSKNPKSIIVGKEGQSLNPRIAKLMKWTGFLGDIADSNVKTARFRMELISKVFGKTRTKRKVAVHDETFKKTLRGSVKTRWYRAEGTSETSGILIYLHGGGWVIGSLDTHDSLCRELAAGSSLRVLSVDYPLAPEHPFPEALKVVVELYEELLSNQPSGILVAIGGDSAGGMLSAQACKVIRDMNIDQPCLQFLIYPVTTIGNHGQSYKDYGTGYFLTKRTIEWFNAHYKGKNEPDLSQDLAGLPPALIYTAGFDPLLDDGIGYHEALLRAGVESHYHCLDNFIHGFINLIGVIPESREAVREMSCRLGQHFQKQKEDPAWKSQAPKPPVSLKRSKVAFQKPTA
jgi:acetyl esterase